MIRTASLSMHVPSSHWNRTRISRYAPTSMLSQRDIGGTGRALSNCVFLRRLRVRRENTAEPARKIRRRRPDIIRTIRSGSSNSRLEASDNRGSRSPSAWLYGFHHVDNLIAPRHAPLAADSTYAYPNQEPNLTKTSRSL